MALAITPFAALCGFLPPTRIATYLRVPELATLIPQDILYKFLAAAPTADPSDPASRQLLRDVFSAVMTAPASTITTQLSNLTTRYEAGALYPEEEDVRELVLRLNAQFPNDIGIFCTFLLNYVKLSPGEAIFLGAGEPHAYISGGQHPSPSSCICTLISYAMQISSNAWPIQTMSSALGSRPNCVTSRTW